MHKLCCGMEEMILNTKIRVCSYNELGEDDKKLVEMAKDATFRAYTPYSNFHVGAALLLENGEVVTGANQENASFPAGTCAERSAIFYAASRYPGVRFVRLAITAWQKGDFVEEPTAPCGVCRQMLYEFCGTDMPVIMAKNEDELKVMTLGELLPEGFGPANLLG